MDENKEELENIVEEIEVTETTEVVEKPVEEIEEVENEVVEEKETQEVPEEEKEQEETLKDTEQYYDELNYQDKEKQKKVKAKTRSILREVLDWVICIVIAYIIYLNVNYFIGSVSGVKQESMYPTIKNGERVLVTRTWLMFRDYKYGDIVTFEAPMESKLYLDIEEFFPTAQYEQLSGITNFLYEFMNVGKVNYVKRVIGLPGDHIQIIDEKVYRNGELLTEEYTRSDRTIEEEECYSDVIVPEGALYVMGDNRDASKDSRDFGCIPFSRVSGYVVCRVWPLNKLGSID